MYLAKRSTEFVHSDDSVLTKVYLIWGLKQQSLDECHHTDVDCTGTIRWDNDFDINDDQSQLALLVSKYSSLVPD